MNYNKIRIPLLTVLVVMMILDLTGVIHVPAIVIFIIAIALLWYNIHIRRNVSNQHNKNKKN
jgi:L-lactate permease